jgi:hypothetical protein
MIKLAEANQTTVQYLAGTTVESSVVTDTLYVQNVLVDFTTGALYATIARGTIVNGMFASNYPSVNVTVNPDGTFISSDGKWFGSLGATASTLVAQLATTFDNFVLAAGLVQGTSEADA